MNYKIALIRGDGIGPEVVGEAVKVMEAVGEEVRPHFTFEDVLMGGCAIDAVGRVLPRRHRREVQGLRRGAAGRRGRPQVGHDKPAEQRPETALLAIRKDLGLYANLRPAALRPAMADACPLKKETAEKGHRPDDGPGAHRRHLLRQAGALSDRGPGVEATDRMAYSEKEIERIGRRAFELARLRRKKVSSVDKANVLETSRLWR